MNAGVVLVADDHPLYRQALALAVAQVAPGARVIEAGTLERAIAAVATAIDLRLILLDLKMPGATGYSGIALLHAERPEVPILVVSSAEGPEVVAHVRRFGAIGFVGKHAGLDELEAAVAAALAGTMVAMPSGSELDDVTERVARLSPMQLKVLLGVLNGQLNKQIAHDLAISEATVKAHMTTLMRKLQVQNRTQAVLAAKALGLSH